MCPLLTEGYLKIRLKKTVTRDTKPSSSFEHVPTLKRMYFNSSKAKRVFGNFIMKSKRIKTIKLYFNKKKKITT